MALALALKECSCYLQAKQGLTVSLIVTVLCDGRHHSRDNVLPLVFRFRLCHRDASVTRCFQGNVHHTGEL